MDPRLASRRFRRGVLLFSYIFIPLDLLLEVLICLAMLVGVIHGQLAVFGILTTNWLNFRIITYRGSK